MPIYVYRCRHCGHQQEVLQKMSDPHLTTCPSCGQETYEKQVTAAEFRLKGTGWYETDFRGGGKHTDTSGTSHSHHSSSSTDSAPAPAAASSAPSSGGGSSAATSG